MSRSPLVDRFSRQVTYLRLSVTDRCNYRCAYCMPLEGIEYVSHSELLTFEEIEEVVGALAELGVRRVRVTGGEPLVRRELTHLIARLGALDGIDEVLMTTNAYLLERHAEELAAVGLAGLNVSLDSLRADRFARITRGGDLMKALAGLRAAKKAGITSIKINAVVIAGFNDDEVADLVRFGAKEGVGVRFIEFMPIGEETIWGNGACVPAREMRRQLAREYEMEPEGFRPGKGPARYWRLFGPALPVQGQRVGFISAVTECFCDHCNRIRITAQGGLRACLADDREVNLRDVLRAGGTRDDLVRAIRMALALKDESHSFEIDGDNATTKQMVNIGG